MFLASLAQLLYYLVHEVDASVMSKPSLLWQLLEDRGDVEIFGTVTNGDHHALIEIPEDADLE